MAKKKSFKADVATAAFISAPQEAAEPKAKTERKPAGRKAKPCVLHKTDGASWSQSGLTADYTRASFIISVKNKQAIEDLAYTNRESIKETLDTIITAYFKTYEKSGNEIIHKKRK